MDKRDKAVTLAVVILGVLIAWSAVTSAQGRTWKDGVWTTPPDDHSYAIETDRDILVLADLTPASTRSFSPAIGTATTFQAGDKASSLRVRDARTGEHTLTLVSQRAKYSTDYRAAGGGHFIKSVGAGGAFVMLEDGSRFDIDPLVQFSVAEWEPDELITVRRSTDDPAFAYEIDNTSRDDGALCNYRKN